MVALGHCLFHYCTHLDVSGRQGITMKSPLPKSAITKTAERVRRFDINPVASQIEPVPVAYLGAAFFNFFVQENAPLSPLCTHSPNNSAVTDQLNSMLQRKTPSISTVYPGSQYFFFNLMAYYLSCGLTLETSVGAPPQACTVQFGGTTISGKAVSE